MKAFFMYALAILSGLFVFGVGVYRGLYDASGESTVTILVHSVITSILIILGGIGLSWSRRWIRKHKKASQDPQNSN
jgi:hypothetical protein